MQSENGSSAVLVVNLVRDDRKRRADTGRGAVNDSVIHYVYVEVYFASTLGKAIAAQEDYDRIIDGMMDLVRANATMNSSEIWSSGEYAEGVKHSQREPITDAEGPSIFIFGAVEFEAWEWIAGPV